MIRRSKNSVIRLLIAMLVSIYLVNHLDMKAIVTDTFNYISMEFWKASNTTVRQESFEIIKVPDFIKISDSSFYIYSAFLDSRSNKKPVLRVLGLIKHLDKTDFLCNQYYNETGELFQSKARVEPMAEQVGTLGEMT